jgi:hypothetical protein
MLNISRVKKYAELHGNMQKYRIKSLYDNNLNAFDEIGKTSAVSMAAMMAGINSVTVPKVSDIMNDLGMNRVTESPISTLIAEMAEVSNNRIKEMVGTISMGKTFAPLRSNS